MKNALVIGIWGLLAVLITAVCIMQPDEKQGREKFYEKVGQFHERY